MRRSGQKMTETLKPLRERLSGAFGFSLTVDVEEWYHTCLVPDYVDPRRRPAGLPDELDRGLPELCELLAAAGCTATFFVLGEVARRLRGRIRELAAAGHEVASHGCLHLRAAERPAAEFVADIRDAKALLEDLVGQPVRGFRAPEWSLRTAASPLLPRVAEAGHLYDSSLAPFLGAGRLSNPRWPTRLAWAVRLPGPAEELVPAERWRGEAAADVLPGETLPGEILEFPPLTFGGPLRLPAGSWTGRLADPMRVTRAAVRHRRRGGLPVTVIHPWEVTGRPTPGRLRGLARFVHETGRLAYRERFGRLLAALPWESLWSAYAGSLVTPEAGAAASAVVEEAAGALAAVRAG